MGFAFRMVTAAVLACALFIGSGARAVCGDSVLETGEQCDDGNTTPFDGCDSVCRIRYCVSPPPTDCIMAGKGLLKVQERGEGDARTSNLKLSLSAFEEELAIADLGDPVTDLTRYDVCIYGDQDAPYTWMVVDRGLDECGPSGKSCWKTAKGGYRFTDADQVSFGVRTMTLVAGPAGGGRIQLVAKRTKKKPWLPPMTTALEADEWAKVRIMTTAGRCIGVDLWDVQVSQTDAFRARTTP